MAEMVKILKRDGPLEHDDIGDFLFGRDYIVQLNDKDLEDNEILLLINFTYYCPKALEKIGCFGLDNIQEFIEDGSYECPFVDGVTFNGVYPLAILSKDVAKYRESRFTGPYFDMAFDTEWTKSMTCAEYKDEKKIIKIPMGNIATTYLGHGYTIGTLPSDGHGRIIYIKVPLSNGDWLVCATWIWYNK